MKRSKKLLISFIKKNRWPYGYLLFFILSCNNEVPLPSFTISAGDSIIEAHKIQRAEIVIDSISKTIHNGDLVTRTGKDFTSESLRSLNQRDKSFSHCGIASIENDSLFIYHALGGDFNPDQKLLREPFKKFADPVGNKGIGLFRFTISDQVITKLLKTVNILFVKGVMFDMSFDLSTDDRMYCAEFVSKSYHIAAGDKLVFPTSMIGKFRFLGVDDIFLHPLCRNISLVWYK